MAFTEVNALYGLNMSVIASFCSGNTGSKADVYM